MSLSESRKYKYFMSTDGNGCPTRYPKLMVAGMTILKQHSNLEEFWYHALIPWVHYVPTGWNGVQEVDTMVKFLRKHDAMAKSIAAESAKFAHKHLITEGRLCYIKVLMEEMAKLMAYKPSPDDFPSTITYEDDVRLYAKTESGEFPGSLVPHKEA